MIRIKRLAERVQYALAHFLHIALLHARRGLHSDLNLVPGRILISLDQGRRGGFRFERIPNQVQIRRLPEFYDDQASTRKIDAIIQAASHKVRQDTNGKQGKRYPVKPPLFTYPVD
jgi:hypothetical protein